MLGICIASKLHSSKVANNALGVCVLAAALYLSRALSLESLGVLLKKRKQSEASEDADFAA
jgi:hypothetical protein